MEAAAHRPEFGPPPPDALWRGFGLALLAHLLLVLGLTQGLDWKSETQQVAVEAELWSRLPQQAAPPEVIPPPPVPVVKAPPLPEPPVVKAPAPPVVKAPPVPEPPAPRDAQIAVEREKQKRELQQRKQAELEREREQQRKREAAKKREKELAQKKEQARQEAEAKRREEEKQRKEQEAREAREARDAKRVAQQREENLRRMQGMAGSGAPSSTGAAAQSSGPSAGWAAKVQARVRPNIVFSDVGDGNPRAVVEVRSAPDGTIVGKKLVRSSGVKSWDEAVLRALDKTETLPRDVDGRVPSPVEIHFRPKD